MAFPDELKFAKVIPLYKSGSSFETKNYRPISILPVFSKIDEKLVYNHVITFINKHTVYYTVISSAFAGNTLLIMLLSHW